MDHMTSDNNKRAWKNTFIIPLSLISLAPGVSFTANDKINHTLMENPLPESLSSNQTLNIA